MILVAVAVVDFERRAHCRKRAARAQRLLLRTGATSSTNQSTLFKPDALYLYTLFNRRQPLQLDTIGLYVKVTS